MGSILAGMPTPLWMLTDPASRRLEVVSFFLVVVLLTALVVKLLWNRSAVEAFGWPRIGYVRSLAMVLLWGCGFVLVLTMISGARELMTPGAWEPDGATYRLAKPRDDVDAGLDAARSARVEALWRALREHANDQGRYPPREQVTGVDWSVPGRIGAEYVYRGPDVEQSDDVLLIEPRVFGETQLVLRANGRVERMGQRELLRLLYDPSYEDEP